MKTKSENKPRSRIREKKTLTPEFMWKTFEEIKNYELIIDKKFYYEKQTMYTRIYLIQVF